MIGVAKHSTYFKKGHVIGMEESKSGRRAVVMVLMDGEMREALAINGLLMMKYKFVEPVSINNFLSNSV